LRRLCLWVSSYCLLAFQVACRYMSYALSLSYIGHKVHPHIVASAAAAGIGPCTPARPPAPRRRSGSQHWIVFDFEMDCGRIHSRPYIVSYIRDLLATLCLDSIHHLVCSHSSFWCMCLAQRVYLGGMVVRHCIPGDNHMRVFVHMCSRLCQDSFFVIVGSRYMSMKFRKIFAAPDTGSRSRCTVVADMLHMTGNHAENTWCRLPTRSVPQGCRTSIFHFTASYRASETDGSLQNMPEGVGRLCK